MKRRNTIDSFYDTTWPICQYYYTHNTGSCDDVLLKRQTTNNKKRRVVSVRKRKRYTYPIVLSDQCTYEQQFKKTTTEPGLILRRWSTVRKQKKRRTLADIISNLTDPSLHNIIDNKNTDDILKSMVLEARWNSIRQYGNSNNGSKIEEELEQVGIRPLLVVKNKGDEKTESTPTISKVTTRTSLTVRIPSPPQTNTTLMDSGININSSLLAHPPSSNSTGRQQLDQQGYSASDTSTDNSIVRISMPITGGSEKQEGHSTLDMFLFLFGFILFPLWWIGSWRYFTRKYDKKDVFQILNCCMSLASLLLIGLIIGLTTVWA